MFTFPRISRVPSKAAVLAFLLFHNGSDSRAWPQYPTVGYTGALPMAVSAHEMTSEFQLGKPAQREDLLRRLGVDPIIAHDASTAVKETAIQVDKLDRAAANLLFVPCGGSGVPTAHLFLLRPTEQHGWRVTDDAPLDCWWSNATYQILSIPRNSSEAVLAHHVNDGHGSGFVQDDMLLFGVHGEHLAILLKTQEYKREDIMGTDETVEQTSTLQPFPDGSLEETRATTMHEMISKVGGDPSQTIERVSLTTIERRRWRWSEPSQTFVPDRFTTVIP